MVFGRWPQTSLGYYLLPLRDSVSVRTIDASLSILAIEKDIAENLEKERDPERIRGLMAESIRLREQLKVGRAAK
jgi:hypothetical protein